MKLHELSPVSGSRPKAYRKGRGPGSGNGKTAGRGHKGQNARSGGGVRPGFEGGQMPLIRRLPKRGFTNVFKKEYAIVNLRDMEKCFSAGETVCLQTLLEKGLVKQTADIYGVKVLGAGTLTKKLTVQAVKFSDTAKAAIEKAGGKAELIVPKVVAEEPKPQSKTKK